MPVGVGTLVGYLVLDDKLSPALKVAQANVASAAKSVKELGTSIQAAGSAFLPVSAAVGAFGAGALTIFADFERGMNRVRAVTGATGTDFDKLNKQAQDLGAKTVFTAREAAEAMGFFGLAGFKVNEILGAMPGALQLASAGQLQVGQAADIVAKIMRGYALDATEVTRINDVLVKSFVSANTDLAQLGEGFKHAGPVAKQFGVQFEEASAALALMADAGFQGSLGGTSLRNALLRLQGVLPESAKLLNQIGLETQTAGGKLLPLADIIEQVEKKGIKAEEMMRLLGVRGGPAFLTLIERGSEKLREFTKMLEDAGGTAARIEKVQLEGLKGQWVLMTSAMEGAAIAIGGALAPAATAVLKPLTTLANTVRDDVVPAFMSWPEMVQKPIIGMTAAVAAAGPVLFATGAAVKAFGFSMDLAKVGIGGVITGLAGMRSAATGAGALMTTFAKVNASAFGGFVPAIRTVGAELALMLPKLTMLAKGASLLGAAIAGWEIGKWVGDLKLFGEEQMSVGESFTFGVLKLQQWTGLLDASDADIENSILAQRNLGKAVNDQAAAFDIASLAIQGYEECVAAAVTPSEQAKNLTAQWNAEMERLKETVAALTTEQREAIRTGLEMEKETEDIAVGMGLSEAAVKAYAAQLAEAGRKVDDLLEKQKRSTAETKDLWSQNAELVADATMTSHDARALAIEENFKREVAAIESTGAVYEKHYAALRANADAALKALSSDWGDVRDKSREALQSQADAARNTYNQMLSSGLTFSRDVLDAQRQKVRDLEDAVRGYGSNWQQSTTAGKSAIEAMNESLDAQIAKVHNVQKAVEQLFHMDIQPLTQTQIRELQMKYDLGGYITRGDPTIALQRAKEELEAREGTHAPRSKSQYLAMIRDQTLLSQLRAMDLDTPAAAEVARQVTAGVLPPPTTSAGIPSRTLVPTAGAGRNVILNNYINGTGEQVARVVSAEMMKQLRVGRQFGAA